MRVLVVALLPLALSACTMIPRTTPPRQTIPQAWHDSGGSRATAAAPETPWWTAFPDTTLRGLIRAALARNTDARSAAENVATAGEYLRMAQAELFPMLTASGSASTGGSRSSAIHTNIGGSPYTSPAQHSSTDQYAARLYASWDADLFGAARSGVAGARARQRETEELRRDVALAIVAQVAGGYAVLRASDRLRSVLERTLADRSRTLDVAQQRAGQAAAASLDVAQARAEVENVRSGLIDVAESATHGEYALSLLTGRAPGLIARPSGTEDQPIAVHVPPILPGVLLERRPDVRAAMQALEAMAADMGQARALLLPRLSLTAGGGYSYYVNRNETHDAQTGEAIPYRTTSSSWSWSLGASISQALFAGGYYRANQRAAESRARRASIAYEAAVLRALLDAEDALASVRFAAQRRASLDSRVDLTRAALTLAQGRYERGEGPFLEVLYAQAANLSAETGAVDAWRAELAAFIDLYRALGGGWESGGSTGAPVPKP